MKELPLLRSIIAMSVGDDGDGECVYLISSIEITTKLCCMCTLGMHYVLFIWIGCYEMLVSLFLFFYFFNEELLSRKYFLLWLLFQLLVFKVANH